MHNKLKVKVSCAASYYVYVASAREARLGEGRLQHNNRRCPGYKH